MPVGDFTFDPAPIKNKTARVNSTPVKKNNAFLLNMIIPPSIKVYENNKIFYSKHFKFYFNPSAFMVLHDISSSTRLMHFKNHHSSSTSSLPPTGIPRLNRKIELWAAPEESISFFLAVSCYLYN
jgi:hypothetical protein